MRFTRVIGILLFLLQASAFAAGPDQIDRYIQHEMERAHIPGAAVAVVKAGKIVKLRTYGSADLEQQVQVGQQSAFQIASATKLFTSVVLMQLVGEGKLDIDAPLTRYITGAPEAWNEITLRHLASHTSGLPPMPFPRDITTTVEAVELAKKQQLTSKPGTRAAYGSLDFSILAHIIERTEGADLPAVIARRITGPLAMTRTRFSQTGLASNQFLMTAELVPGRVTTYEWMRDHQQAYRALYMNYTFAAGGAFSSIADMAAFAKGLGGGALLAKDLCETMWKPARLSNGTSAGFGLGFTIATFRGQREIGHAGGPALADVAFYPEQDLAVVVLTNQRALIPYLARGVAAAYLPAPGWLNESGITDRDPARTANFKAALAAVASGGDPVAAFAAGSEKSAEEFSFWLSIPLGSYPPLSRLVLLKDEDGKLRSYRAHFGDKMSQRFNAKFADDARLLSIEPVDE